MTTPGSADQVVFDQLNGGHPGAWDLYQVVRVFARTVWGDCDSYPPFQFPLGPNGAPVAASPASYDAITGASRQTSWRHIDPFGNVAELKKLGYLLWYWMLDGCPTNMGDIGSETSRFALYMTLAKQLRPWPTNCKGAMPGDPTQDYPAFPPTKNTPLDGFKSQTFKEEQPDLPHPLMAERFAAQPGSPPVPPAPEPAPAGWGGGGGGWGPHGGPGPGPWGPHGGGGGPHDGPGPGGWGGGHRDWDGPGGGHGWHRGWGPRGWGPGWDHDFAPPWWYWLLHTQAPAAPAFTPPPPPWSGPWP